jgi:hypothetical protein
MSLSLSTLTLAGLLTLAAQETPPSTSPEAPAAEAPAAEAQEATPAHEDAADEEGDEAAEAPLSRVTLEDGQVLIGRVVSRNKEELVLELASGARMEIAASAVKSVEEEKRAQVRASGELWFQDPNRTRYLYVPSAFMLRADEGYFSQKELVFSSLSYGLTDNITLQAGAIIPAWFAPDGQGLNFIGGIKVGGSLSENFHLAGGAQALVLPGIFGGSVAGGGLLFGTATYGTPDAHVSVAGGIPFLLGNNLNVSNLLILTVSGNIRMGQGTALVTENWILPAVQFNQELPMLNSLALRFFGTNWAVDVGAVRVPGSAIPLPWLDFAYNFGG